MSNKLDYLRPMLLSGSGTSPFGFGGLTPDDPGDDPIGNPSWEEYPNNDSGEGEN